MSKKFLAITAILFAISLLWASQITPAQAYTLTISIATDKSIYNVGEIVQTNGNLTLDLVPVSGALVALQINDRALPYVFRTLYTGAPPSGPWYVEITSAYIGDTNGNPLTSLRRGALCYIWIYYQNTYEYSLNVTIAFTIYNVNQSPLFAQTPIRQLLPPGTGYFVAYAWQIPTDADPGPATIYASAFTALPMNGGTPYSPEKHSTFNITKTDLPTSLGGNYNNQFQIAKRNSRLGDYNAYVASFYQGYMETNSTSYEVILLGDINGDKFINVKDAVLLNAAFGSHEGQDPEYNPNADLNKDTYINIKDAVILGANYGNSAI